MVVADCQYLERKFGVLTYMLKTTKCYGGIGMKYRYAICEWCLPVNGPSSVRLASQLGFDGIQLGDLGGASRGFPMNDECIQQLLLETASSCNIELQALHLQSLLHQDKMLYPPNTTQSDDLKLCIDKGIESCVALGIPTLFLSSFLKLFIYNKFQFENFAAHLRYANQMAQANGIQVLYESVLPLDKQYKMLELAGDGVGVLYDILNPICYGSGLPWEEIKQLGASLINQVHVKDRESDHRTYCLLGKGIAQAEKSAQALREIDWSGWLVAETVYTEMPFSEDTTSTDNAIVDLQTMKTLWDNKK